MSQVQPRGRRVISRLLGAPGAVAGTVVLVVILALAVLAPLLAPYDWNATSQCRRLAPISADHWFGCDLFGRDILSRVMYGARFSLAMGVSTVAISLVAGAEVLGQGLVRAIWTDDEALSTKINSRVAHYTGQAELADAIQEGLEARKQGDEETATAKLGRAVALAHQSGNEDTAKLLAKVVDVVDVESGTVRLKKKVEDADEMALDTRSTKTVRVKK